MLKKKSKNIAENAVNTTVDINQMEPDLKQKVFNIYGEDTNLIVELPEIIFNRELSPVLMKEVILYHQNKKRAATANAKSRGELAYSTKKLRPQKGTGRARIGAKGAPHHRGGGVAFGPNGRIYETAIPAKKRRAALAMALTMKLKSKQLIIVDKLDLPVIKTKQFVECMSKFNVEKGLLINHERNLNVEKSMSNLFKFDFLLTDGINTLAIIKSHYCMISVDALEKIKELYV